MTTTTPFIGFGNGKIVSPPEEISLASSPLKSRKRAVSVGGKSDSRLVFSKPLLPLDESLKSLSLSFNFNPPKQGTVSFTSTASGKWWKSKFGLKKLVNSVRQKRKTKTTNNKSDLAHKKNKGSSKKNSNLDLELKKRRIDFEKDFMHKPSSVQNQTNTAMEVAQPAVLRQESGRNSTAAESGILTSKMPAGNPSLSASTSPARNQSSVGPGGETNQSPQSSSFIDLEKDNIGYQTPGESICEMKTESDASFVICDSTEEFADASAISHMDQETDLAADAKNSPARKSKDAEATEGKRSESINKTATEIKSESETRQSTSDCASDNDPTVISSDAAAPSTSGHCQKCSCCQPNNIDLNRWNTIILFVAAALGMVFQYCYVFPFIKSFF